MGRIDATPLLIVAGVMWLSVHLGPDASWDLRNYHLYNAFALLRKAPGTDMLGGQMQGYLPPWPDVPSYWLRLRLNKQPGVLDALLALPSAGAAVVAYFIAREVLGAVRWRWVFALLAVGGGVTGASGLPTTGTTASEMPAGALVLGALLLMLRCLDQPKWRAISAAGALLGVAVAIKLTVVPFVLAAGVAFTVCASGGWRRRFVDVMQLGAGFAVGALLAGGPWWLHLYLQTGNPIFPYYNNIFHSPLNPPIAMTDDRFLPRSFLQAVFYPFYWGFQKNHLVTEMVMRDPRVAFAVLATLWFAVAALVRRQARRVSVCVCVFLVVGYVAWLREFSIFRYLAPLELLAGVALLLPLRPAIVARPVGTMAALVGLGVFLALFTRYPDWGRANPADRAASVAVPALPANSMVLLLDNDPLGYVAAYAKPAVRFISVNNNLIHPGIDTELEREVEAAVRGHNGPLFGVQTAGSAQTMPVLSFYHLRISAPCEPIRSNLDGSSLQLCPLEQSP